MKNILIGVIIGIAVIAFILGFAWLVTPVYKNVYVANDRFGAPTVYYSKGNRFWAAYVWETAFETQEDAETYARMLREE